MKYLVDFKNDTVDSDIQQYFSDNGCSVLKTWNNFEKAFLVECSNVLPLTNIVERIEEESPTAIKPHNVVTLDPYHYCHNNPNYPPLNININDEKDWWKNFSYLQPKFEGDTLELRRMGKNIDVYIMDSGIEETHPEFVDANIVKLYSVTGTDFTDRNGHGTAMAGVIVGKTCGITDATIKVVKIFDPTHDTLQSEFLDALNAIIEDHEDNTFAVLNASWSIPRNQYIEHKLSLAVEEGIFVIAAAGNNGTPIDDVTPAAMIEALTVGAYNQNLEPCDFSNYTGIITTNSGVTNHGELDGWAPGENIWTASLGGEYGYASGTSMAAAVTSAILTSNLSWKVDEDGNRSPVYRNLTLRSDDYGILYSTLIVFARPDLLDFNDPKYSNSRNLLATIWDNCIKERQQMPDEMSFVRKVGVTSGAVLYSQVLTKEITWLTPLPENWYLDGNGFLQITPTAEQGPQAGQHYNLIQLKFLRKELNDVEETVTLNVYIIEQTKDISEIPPDDPIIPITLLVDCAGNGCLSGTTSNCQDVCPLSTCCAGTKSNAFRCRCDEMTL